MITPVITLAAFLLLLRRQKLEIFRAKPLGGAASILAAPFISSNFESAAEKPFCRFNRRVVLLSAGRLVLFQASGVAGIEQIDLLEIDTEKSEFDVLRGIEEND